MMEQAQRLETFEMARNSKELLYRLARAFGLFALARRLTRKQLRILAYHAFGEGEFLEFRPKLFISVRTLDRRLALLKRWGYRLRSMDEVQQALEQGRPFHQEAAVTVDDGYASTLHLAGPVFKRHHCPALVYVTTYHVFRQTPVFDLVIGYMLWKTQSHALRWAWPEGTAARTWSLGSPAERAAAGDALIDQGRRLASEDERVALCEALGDAVEVPYRQVVASEAFRLMSPPEVRALADHGVQVGLHTHRHRFPPHDLQVCRQEILENQHWLREITGETVLHFCYPSGVFHPRQWPLLQELGMMSSTTCEPGNVSVGDPIHGLSRFLDGEMVSDLEFEAEICGFAGLLRKLAGRR